jgi:hypothetical protein
MAKTSDTTSYKLYLLSDYDDDGNVITTEQPATSMEAAKDLAKISGHPDATVTLVQPSRPQRKGFFGR